MLFAFDSLKFPYNQIENELKHSFVANNVGKSPLFDLTKYKFEETTEK